MFKRLFWIGIGAVAGWMAKDVFTEKKNQFNAQLEEKGLAYPLQLATDTGRTLINLVVKLVRIGFSSSSSPKH